MTPTSPTSDPGGQSPGSTTRPVLITESTDQGTNPPQPKTSTTQRSTPDGSGGKGEFRPLPFLYRMLVGIFLVETLFLAMTYRGCMNMQRISGGQHPRNLPAFSRTFRQFIWRFGNCHRAQPDDRPSGGEFQKEGLDGLGVPDDPAFTGQPFPSFLGFCDWKVKDISHPVHVAVQPDETAHDARAML